jgi:hypothetical protein
MTIFSKHKIVSGLAFILILVSSSLSLVDTARAVNIQGNVGGVGFCAGPNGGTLIIPGLVISYGNCGQYGGSWQGPIPQYIGPGGSNAPIQDVNEVFAVLIGVIKIAQIVFWILAVAFGLYAAYLYLFAAGNKENAAKARRVLLYTVIAIILAIVAYSIPTVIDRFLTG